MSSPEEPKPLGTYACGGKCDPEGFQPDGQFEDRHPCRKCRVYKVVPDRGSVERGILVRARNAADAVAIYEAARPNTAKRLTVHRYNHDWNKGAVSLDWRRNAAGVWERKLSRYTREQAIAEIVYRVRQTSTVAMRDWKLSREDVVAAFTVGLRQFKKENGL